MNTAKIANNIRMHCRMAVGHQEISRSRSPAAVIGAITAMLLCCLPAGGRALVSSGGVYSMERSIIAPGMSGDIAASGMSIVFCFGELFYPSSGDRTRLAAEPFVLYDGFFGEKFPDNHLLSNFIRLPCGAGWCAGWLRIPAGAIPFDYEIYARVNPQFYSLRVPAATIFSANSKIERNRGRFSKPLFNGIIEINSADKAGNYYMGTLKKALTLSLNYKDANHDGIIDGTMPPVKEKTLSSWFLNEQGELWIRIPKAFTDYSSNAVSYSVRKLGVFSLFGVTDTTMDDFYAYPVPWRPNAGSSEFRAPNITFVNLPDEGTIKIFNLAGELVKTIEIPGALFPSLLEWNVKNNAGEDVVSGVYIWQASSGDKTKSGKLMIIR